jgi:hypothetical protein
MLQSLLKSHPEYPSLQPLEQDELIKNFTLDVKMKSNAEYLTSLGEVNGNYQNQVGDVIRKNFEYIRSEAGTMRRSSG